MDPSVIRQRIRSISAPSWAGPTARAVLLVALVALVMLVGFRVARGGVLPGVEVAGVEVGGANRGELRELLGEADRRRAERTMEVVRPATEVADRESVQYAAEDLGYEMDVDATAARVLHRGRQGNPVAALVDHVRATFAATTVEPVERLDRDAFEAWLGDVRDRLQAAPREGDLRFDGDIVRPVMPALGSVMAEDDLLRKARRAVFGSGDATIAPETEPVEPRTSHAAVRDALRRARRALSGDVILVRGERRLSLSPSQLGRMLSTRRVDRGGEAVLRLRVSVDSLREIAGDEISRLQSDPRDARLVLRDGSVEVVPSRRGFAVDHRALARRLVQTATSDDDRTLRVPGDRIAPSFSTADAEALDIDEEVSSFTTNHACCQPRVQNIHRIADMIDGTVVRPGQAFSLNESVGERTRSKGFVPAPSIRAGEYVDEVGGGISQFATTLFNAIFFGGYDFVEHQPHSYYISRYPPGREATVSWPRPDLSFTNDSDAGVYIATSYTGTSITVTFYGNTEVDVSADMGERHNFKNPPTRCRENEDLAGGERRVVQEGTRGFDIVVRRVFTFPSGNSESERFFTRYDPEPRIVERRSCP